jgi:hypothetical protein
MVKLLLCIFFKRMTLIDVLINIISLIWLSKCIWLVYVSLYLPFRIICGCFTWVVGESPEHHTHIHTCPSILNQTIPQKFQKVLFIYLEAKQQTWTDKQLAPQVKLLGRGPAQVSPAYHWIWTQDLFVIPGSQKAGRLYQWVIMPWVNFRVVKYPILICHNSSKKISIFLFVSK